MVINRKFQTQKVKIKEPIKIIFNFGKNKYQRQQSISFLELLKIEYAIPSKIKNVLWVSSKDLDKIKKELDKLGISYNLKLFS